ncbi:MAG: TetR/AcrR family transcriptional regulator [Planctomycetota bacterium]
MNSGELTKERLLDEATKLFHQRGFGATSLNDLMAAAGVKKGTLYYTGRG